VQHAPGPCTGGDKEHLGFLPLHNTNHGADLGADTRRTHLIRLDILQIRDGGFGGVPRPQNNYLTRERSIPLRVFKTAWKISIERHLELRWTIYLEALGRLPCMLRPIYRDLTPGERR
jgi:hypothetical protein